MDNSLFDWDDANVSHFAGHKVTPEEAEEVLLGDPLDLGSEPVDGENRWSYIGETVAGRILRLTITIRGERIRVVTAFAAPKYWKAFYLGQEAGQQ